jgi:hypothetical protein
VNGLLPSRPFALECLSAREDAVRSLVAALPAARQIEFPRWRVRGTATAEGVTLWYSLRGRPLPLAPQLFAAWQPADGAARLAGRFEQQPRVARLVLWTGVALAAGLVMLAVRGGVSWPLALGAGALLAGYPWVAWFMHGHHVEKIDAFLQETIGRTPAEQARPLR